MRGDAAEHSAALDASAALWRQRIPADTSRRESFTRAACAAVLCASSLVMGPAAGAGDGTFRREPAAPVVTCGQRQDVTLAAPESGHVYHSAYFSPTPNEITVTDQSIEDFNALAQKDVAAVVFSDPWGRNGHTRIRFPGGKVSTIWNHGAIPVVRMMPWTKLWVTQNQPVTMQKVIDGRYDGQLLRWFRRAEALGIPMLVEFGVEVNGDWFPWNGRWNGGGRSDGYGNPREADGPERFRDAYRHLVELSRRTGAERIITWGFHVDADGWPRTSWNTPASYYPGRRYVDWLEVSDYGEQKPSENPSHWFPF